MRAAGWIALITAIIMVVTTGSHAEGGEIVFKYKTISDISDIGFKIDAEIGDNNIYIFYTAPAMKTIGLMRIDKSSYNKDKWIIENLVDLSKINGLALEGGIIYYNHSIYYTYYDIRNKSLIFSKVYLTSNIPSLNSLSLDLSKDKIIGSGPFIGGSVVNSKPTFVFTREEDNSLNLSIWDDGNNSWKIIKLSKLEKITNVPPSVFELGDRVGIIYTDAKFQRLKLAISDSDDLDEWSVYTIDSTVGSGNVGNVIYRDGIIYLTYFDYLNKWTKFARNLYPYKYDQWVVEVVDWNGFLCYTTHIALTSDRIWIVYHDLENDQLKLATRPLSVKYGGWQVVPVTTDGVGAYSDIVVVNDQPLIFYSEFSSKRAKEGIKGIRLAIPVIKESDEDEDKVETDKR